MVLDINISISPENLQKLNRGEKVTWAGVAHPELNISLVPLQASNVPIVNKEPALQSKIEL